MLLDEHISPAVARGLSGQGHTVAALRDWNDGAYLEQADEAILQATHADGWTLVTYDLRTFPPLLKRWAEQGIVHGGVILVDERSIAQNDTGGQMRALRRLVAASGDDRWESRVVFLSR